MKTAIWDKADTTVDEMERALDDVGRKRYQWLLDQSRGFIAEGREKGVPAVEGRRRRGARAHRAAPEGPLPRGPRRQARRPRR